MSRCRLSRILRHRGLAAGSAVASADGKSFRAAIVRLPTRLDDGDVGDLAEQVETREGWVEKFIGDAVGWTTTTRQRAPAPWR
jgi:class 3 adenylate cyclase